ncbi:MAG: superoxide dismutase [Ni] [Candidatus Marinimicrobia bacterium]|jgi:nickel superoxide dismutase|nr:superoxide dismutase [Ni] [Candidatus Neomarinimicrobiota bacterium]MDP6935837.1 superoxide dismutase [Ni] [Candidatus Neomarinimicrobiota bacterium]
MKNKNQIYLLSLSIVTIQVLWSHCQVPCGIYDDKARISAMTEDVATIEKATKNIIELTEKTDTKSQNQHTRWIMTKEDHAQKIISTISDYFLTQRVKPDHKDYNRRLAEHHAVMINAMKTKQNTDLELVNNLKESIEKISGYYP